MGFHYTNAVTKTSSGQGSKYPSWKDGSPNLYTFVTAINLSNPIIQSQYEMVYSRWPRTIFFAKNITIPGVSLNTIEINHAGFVISIATHAKYETTEISFTIIADKEGLHYYDWRNIVLQGGHPLVAGDTKSTIGNQDLPSSSEDTIDVKLRNDPSLSDSTFHHWVIHNFRPTKIGDVELTQDGSAFVEFEITGTFTHIDQDGGQNTTPAQKKEPSEEETVDESSDETPEDEDYDEPDEDEDEDEEEEIEPIDYDDLDDDTKQAVDIMDEYGPDTPDDILEDAIRDAIKDANPDISDEELDERAADALENAKNFMEQENEDEEDDEDEEEEIEPIDYDDLDDNAKTAVDIIDKYGQDDLFLEYEIKNELLKKHPDMNLDQVKVLAQKALDDAKEYLQNRSDDSSSESSSEEQTSKFESLF